MTETWRYEEARPGPALRRQVAAFWQITGPARGIPLPHRVLPDGCVDIIFDLAQGVAPLVVGTMTTAVTVPLTPGTDLFGIRFRPGAAGAWLRTPVNLLTDRDAEAASDVVRIPSFESAGKSFPLRTETATAWLVGQMRETSGAGVMRAAIEALRNESSVEATARQLGISERKLQRNFQKAVGLTPGQFRRIARFRRAIAHLAVEADRASKAAAANGTTTTYLPGAIAAAAAAAGYYDQPHFDHEFRRLAGCTPREWLSPAGGLVQDAALAVF